MLTLLLLKRPRPTTRKTDQTIDMNLKRGSDKKGEPFSEK